EPGTDALAGLSKVVFSTTLQEPLAWPNTRLVTQDAVEVVRDMKDEGANHMTTMGSLTLCRSLLKAGLVDRFRVVVFPVITGSTGSTYPRGSSTSPRRRHWPATSAPRISRSLPPAASSAVATASPMSPVRYVTSGPAGSGGRWVRTNIGPEKG